MKRRNEQSLGEAIARLIDDAGMRERVDEAAIRTEWEELAGAVVARHTTAIELRRGTLTIRVDSAPLRQELTFLRGTIAERVNERLGRVAVTEVRVG